MSGGGEPCRLCGADTAVCFEARVLARHRARYCRCGRCGLLQAEGPHWLAEAYANPIADSDTGGLSRCLALAEAVSPLCRWVFGRGGRYLDYAGGHGLFTRRMRDVGFDFRWQDRFAANLFARGFEDDGGPVAAVTCIEGFEHFAEPAREIGAMLARSPNLVFTTDLLPEPVPAPEAWYYYGLHHGQHVCFYAARTLEYLAREHGLRRVHAPPLHLLVSPAVSAAKVRLLVRLRRALFPWVRRSLVGLTVGDSIALAGRERAEGDGSGG